MRSVFKILILIFAGLFLSSSAYAITASGTSIEVHGEMYFDGGMITSETTIVTVEQMYGIMVEPASLDGYEIPGATHCFPLSLKNLGNGTDYVTFQFISTTPESWTYSLIRDDDQDGTYEAGENTLLDNPLPISEEGLLYFFLSVSIPSSEVTGTTGKAILGATGEVYDGGTYIGANGTIYGGPDTAEVTAVLTCESLKNLRINRSDITGEIYITWTGGNADIYFVDNTYEVSTSSYTIEATNVSSPYYCASIEAKDGKTRYYKVALAGTSSFALQTVGKFDLPVTVGINQLSSPFVLYETEIKKVVGSQVTGAQNSPSADRLWTYNPSAQGQFDISWLVGGVGPPYDGLWYAGNNPTTDKVGTDEGWYLQIRDGHPATYVTMIGEVSRVNRSVPISVGMNLVGSCFPVSVTLEGSNLWGSGMTGSTNSPSADRIWMYNPALQGQFYIAWLVEGVGPAYDGKWYSGNYPTTMKLIPGKGYWVQVRSGHTPFTWDYVKPY
jgi:hypothetical protein